MTVDDISCAVDVHDLLDRLAMCSPQDYYRVNHVPASSIAELRDRIVAVIAEWCVQNNLVQQ